MTTRKYKPVHPGQVLKLDFMQPMGVTAYRLSKETGITAQHLGRIIGGLQAHYELDRVEDESDREIETRVKPWKTAGKAA